LDIKANLYRFNLLHAAAVKIDTTPMEGFAAQFNEILGLENLTKRFSNCSIGYRHDEDETALQKS
jgi:hypothetical protein